MANVYIIKKSESKKFFNGLAHCYRGLSKDRKYHRPYMSYIYVNDNVGHGTNGARIHIASGVDGLSDGYYDVVKSTRSEVCIMEVDIKAEYPDISRSIDLFNGSNKLKHICEIELDLLYTGIVRMYKKQYISYEYLKAAIGPNPIDSFTAYFIDDKSPVCLKSDDGLVAYIMPKSA